MKIKTFGLIVSTLLIFSSYTLYSDTKKEIANLNSLKNQTYNLRNMVNEEYHASIPLKISTGDQGRLSITYKQKRVEGDSSRVVNFITNMEIGELSYHLNELYYFNKSGNIVKIEDVNSSKRCLIINRPKPLPTEAKIGDSGVDSELHCDDGTKTTTKWALVIDKNMAVFKSTTDIFDNSTNRLISRGTEYYAITPKGEVKKMKIEIEIDNELNITSKYQDVDMR